MPSYYRRPLRYRCSSRTQFLAALAAERRKRFGRSELEKIFDGLARVLPHSRRQSADPGFTQTTVRLSKPKLPKKQFRRLLYELRHDGLVKTDDDLKNPLFALTARALTWMKKFNEKPHWVAAEYPEPEKSDRLTIVSYDIPENRRQYRDWTREILARLGFKKMQRSVWIGKIKLPINFIADLTRFGLEKYVEIFEITKTGTLRHRL